jgi:UDP-2,4-diacetamido-2,4,6-trideoxy-beta-L-altropyranose hydrolase
MGAIAPHLLLRADAAVAMGSGHLMRCLALAHAWRQAGGKATFLTHTDRTALLPQVCEAGHELITLPHPHPHPQDLTTTIQVMRSCGARWLALDGYHFDADYHAAIRAAGLRLLAIDDNAHLPRYEADLILNQNLHAAQLAYALPASARLLAGPRYALLRPEFTAGRGVRRADGNGLRRILVTLGGSDPHNVTAAVLHALNHLAAISPEIRLQVDVAVGPGNPHRAMLEQMQRQSAHTIELVTPRISWHATQEQAATTSAPAMSELMAQADVAISAAGSTCWELARMGLPALLIVIAANQEQIAQSLEAAGCAISLGRSQDLTPERIATTLAALLADKARCQAMRLAGRRLVDGRGAARVVDTLRRADAQPR